MANEFDLQNIRQSRGRVNEMLSNITGADQEPEVVEKIVEVVPENALIHQPDGTIIYKRFVMKPTGIDIPADCEGEEWKDVGYIIRGLDSSISWVIGDWALFAMQTWGLTASQIADMFGYDTNTIEVYASICRTVYGLIRNQASSFGHARLVANLTADQQAVWLAAATNNKWTISQMRQAMKPRSQQTSNGQLTLPGFGAEHVKARRKHETRLTNWQEGKLNLTPTEALDEINALIDHWTAQRDALIEQTSDRDGN